MTMITKLQEEKSAIQMEALQYQRMMEEQAEYDQEALQLLNDLMIKREKEKLELEKELNLYRNNVMGYKDGEKTMMVKSIKSSYSSSQDYSQEQNLDDVLEDFDQHEISLAEFDEERVSILDELKYLEAKLFASHNHETHNNNVTNDEEKGALDTSSDDKSRFERKTIDLTSKKLLPLFDAMDNEFTEDLINENELERSKLIQDEFGNLYERLQALEADKEFLKHCIRSMMKGNKGLFSLLQEILQHLRDLRSVELPAEKLADSSIDDLLLDKKDQW